MHRYRSHTCGGLSAAEIGATARLSGWCHRIRDHGGVLFIDLRDHYGMTQIVVDPDSPAFKDAEKVRAEWVIRVDGKVRARPAGTENANLATGQIEMFVTELEVLGAAAELPVPVFGDVEYPEDQRLKFRFLDLRREKLHNNIMTRVKVIDSMRRRMKEAGFNEFSTPILTASSPEGARDFLVPSRIHPGQFYALPQAPQQYKQLLMMAGFDRYFQIAPCFRDEDPRADRLPGEFYQLDVEMSFVEQNDVFAAMEPVIRGVFEEFANGRPVTPSPWPRIPYAESMAKYGSDKPDLRNPIVMQDVSDIFRDSGFKVFADILTKEKNAVWAIPAPSGGSRAFCDRMDSWAKGEGQQGLAHIFFVKEPDEYRQLALESGDSEEQINSSDFTIARGPIPKRIGREKVRQLREQFKLNAGDAIFFVAGDPEKFVKFAGAARNKVGEDLNLTDKNRFEFAWITDFPFYEWNEEEKRIDFSHNPFSMPQGGLEALQTQDPLTIKAFQYDIACNGFELASGGIRNHKPDAMVKAFEIAGYGEETVVERFGGMYRAFQYGAPPHGGMAAGVDRVIMLLCDAQNLREVALFPMNQSALDLLMGAPSQASTKQLRELHLRLNLPEK
ncbi:MAG: aspartate--tRNA ligase [Rhizobiales bacterium]|nr:aspartate--tRNA ligase [Hyphomicrobiales bacterium]